MKKLISILLVAAMLFGCFAGCSRKSKDKNTADGGKKTTANTQGPKRGPVGVWDIPIPEINPLGSQDLYVSTGYEKGVNIHTVKYIENYVENRKDIYGEMWTLEVHDPSGIPLEFLKEYVQEIGGTTFSGAYGDRFTFTYKKDDESLWWGDAVLKDEGYQLTVIKERRVPAGKEVKFGIEDYSSEDEPMVTFVTQTEGKRFQSASINVPDGRLYLEISSENWTSIYRRSINYYKELSSEKTNKFILDDLPQSSDAMIWKFTWESDSAPHEFTFRLEELGEIPQIKYGDELGALKVCGYFAEGASVEPQEYMYYESESEELNFNGDITPEGDQLFWLPAGYWNVILPSDSAGIEETRARLVPVSSGEMTILTVPESVNSAHTALSLEFASMDNFTGAIEIMEAKENGDTATISFVVNDPKDRDVFPDKENTAIIEGGKKVEILDISRKVLPPSVVLVLDSSGSMGKLMDATLESARKFIRGLPDGTYIKVIDFDTEVKVLKGEAKDAVIKSLSSVKASGSTKLFDATIEAIGLLEGKNRPAVVLFADGADSSIDGQGEGSYSTMEDVISVIKDNNIPLYTIGFGDGADKKALREFAAASGGQYYDARDNKALDSVFEAIGSKFGNSFEIKYRRPTEAALSDTPAVTLIMDASGSMDTSPEEDEGCDFRMDKTKTLFHDFVQKLPDGCMMQMISFQTGPLGSLEIRQGQIITDSKPAILHAIGNMKADGGTPILEAVKVGYENLRAIPSSKKAIVFVTDAGLEVDEEYQAEFEVLLNDLKKDGINVLWAGIGVADREDLFSRAAELSGGRYIVKDNVDDLKAALDETLGLLNRESSSATIPLSITINEKTSSGDIFNYSAATNVEFTKPKRSGTPAKITPVSYTTGTRLSSYDNRLTTLVTGTSILGSDTILNKRMTLNAKSSNKAAEITVKEAFLFEKFMGLDPGNMQFLALEIEMKNVTAEKIQYQIPSFRNHFFITINNEGSYPASDATWLAEKPLSAPGEYAVDVYPGKTLSGMLVFLVPEVALTQFSLHLYDTSYGHVHIPLAGRMILDPVELAGLPSTAPAKISDAFSMTVKAVGTMDKIQQYEATGNTTFRVIEADFDSKVQALLNIDPAERLWMKIDTGAGPLMTKMSDVTALLPFGFMSPVMLAPSSSNKVRMVYPIAKSLLGAKAEIWGDLDSGSLNVPVINGNPYGSTVNKPYVQAFGMQLRVNQLTTLEGIEGYGSSCVISDVTFMCPEGVEGAVIPEDMFCLVREDWLDAFNGGNMPQAGGDTGDGYEEDYGEYPEDESYEDDSYEEDESNDDEDGSSSGIGLGNFGQVRMNTGSMDTEGIKAPMQMDLLYDIDGDWAVFSGSQRRGVVLFYIDGSEGSSKKWILKSKYFPDLNVTVSNEKYASPELLANNLSVDVFDDNFENELADAVQEAIKRYQSYKSAEGKAGYLKTVGLEQTAGKNSIPVPTIVAHGITKIRSVSTPDQAVSIMKTLKWLPSGEERSYYRYSPEAVLTQSWGSEWDLANLALSLFSKSGSKPKLYNMALTEKGQKTLIEMTGLNGIEYRLIPGIKYTDASGNPKVFVIPFMKDITELEGLVYFTSSEGSPEINPIEARLTVYAIAETKAGSASSLARDIGSILGGGESGGVIREDIELLTKDLTLPELSIDVIEVGYAEAGPGTGSGKLYTAVITTPGGQESGQYGVDTGISKVKGIKIELELNIGGTISHVSTLPESDTPDRVWHSIAINLPDITEDAAKTLEDAWNKEYRAAQNPSSVSALRWYGRNIINRFITTQTAYDKEVGANLGLILGRTTRPRFMVLTSRLSSRDNKFWTSLDLVQAANQCHGGSDEAVKAYNVGSGLFLSLLEGEVIPGANMNFRKSWENAPEGTRLVFVPGGEFDREIFIEPMRKYGFPERLLYSVENTKNIIFVPDRPTMFGGEKRWMWLEIDPETYETIAVSDTGEHMGAGYIMNLTRSVIMGGANYMAGVFFGLETAVWTVAAYSLKYGDYENILKAAEITTKEIGKHVAKVHAAYVDPVGTLKDTIKDESGLSEATTVNKGDVSFSVGEGGLDVKGPGIKININVVDLCLMELEMKIELGIVPTFGDGFNDAAEFYFRHSRDEGGSSGGSNGSGN